MNMFEKNGNTFLSKLMIFKPRQKRQTYDLAFLIDGTPVYLGIVNDKNLTLKPHILNVLRKISKFIGILYNSSILFYTLIYP